MHIVYAHSEIVGRCIAFSKALNMDRYKRGGVCAARWRLYNGTNSTSPINAIVSFQVAYKPYSESII